MANEWVGRLQRGYEAFNRGDLDGVLRELGPTAPDIEFRDRPEAPDHSTYSGMDQVRFVMGQVGAEFDDYRIDPEEFVEVGENIVVAVRQTGRGKLSGVPVDEVLFHVWVVRDDVVAGLQAYTEREDALRAAAEPAN